MIDRACKDLSPPFCEHCSQQVTLELSKWLYIIKRPHSKAMSKSPISAGPQFAPVITPFCRLLDFRASG
jgi:hypothetical protein